MVVNELVVELIRKGEESRPFGCTTDIIVEKFDVYSSISIVFRPVDRFRATLQEAVQYLRMAKNGLLQQEADLSAAGRLKFASIFAPGGRLSLDSIYRCVAANPRLDTRTSQVPVSSHFVAQAEDLLRAVAAHAHTVCYPHYFVRTGLLGAEADASTAFKKGWGACLQGVRASDTWDAPTCADPVKERNIISLSESRL